MSQNQNLDILAFGAHPDDAEFGCGGLLLKAVDRGHKVGIADFTQAELSTKGNTELRKREAEEARKALGAEVRENLGLPDNFLFPSRETIDAVVRVVRKYRPRVALAPYFNDRHPDHENASRLVRHAMFTAGLPQYKDGEGLAAHRPDYVFFYMLWHEFEPSLIVDITDVWEKKVQVIQAFGSQFEGVGEGMSEETKWVLESRARQYGRKIKRRYGEPYLSINSLGADDIFSILPNYF